MLELPRRALVVLIGASGSGKSTFARKHFKPTEVVSSDACRALVSDDEANQDATDEAFEVLHLIVAKRLSLGRLAVVDATNVHPESRKNLLEIAQRFHTPAFALVLDVDADVCRERNRARTDRRVGSSVVGNQRKLLDDSLPTLASEGFATVHLLKAADIEAVEFVRAA